MAAEARSAPHVWHSRCLGIARTHGVVPMEKDCMWTIEATASYCSQIRSLSSDLRLRQCLRLAEADPLRGLFVQADGAHCGCTPDRVRRQAASGMAPAGTSPETRQPTCMQKRRGPRSWDSQCERLRRGIALC